MAGAFRSGRGKEQCLASQIDAATPPIGLIVMMALLMSKKTTRPRNRLMLLGDAMISQR